MKRTIYVHTLKASHHPHHVPATFSQQLGLSWGTQQVRGVDSLARIRVEQEQSREIRERRGWPVPEYDYVRVVIDE